MDELLHQTTGNVLFNAMVSAIFLTSVFGVRLIVLRGVLRRGDLTAEARRRWIVNSRNILLLVLVTGLVAIWANELLTFAVSLVAIAAALVIATKELILCFSGAILRAASKAFSLGDLIEIAGIRGDVVDINVFAATIREIGPGKGSHQYTGRAVIVPNSLLLNNPLVNHSYLGDYLVHIISIPWKMEDDWIEAERLLLKAAEAECAPFIEEARRHVKRLEDREGLEPISIEPRVTIEIPEPNRINFLLRFPSPARRQQRLEQAIVRRFLGSLQQASTSAPQKTESHVHS